MFIMTTSILKNLDYSYRIKPVNIGIKISFNFNNKWSAEKNQFALQGNTRYDIKISFIGVKTQQINNKNVILCILSVTGYDAVFAVFSSFVFSGLKQYFKDLYADRFKTRRVVYIYRHY